MIYALYLKLIIIRMKINNVNFFLFFFIIQLTSGQIFQTERLKMRKTKKNLQGSPEPYEDMIRLNKLDP